MNVQSLHIVFLVVTVSCSSSLWSNWSLLFQCFLTGLLCLFGSDKPGVHRASTIRIVVSVGYFGSPWELIVRVLRISNSDCAHPSLNSVWAGSLNILDVIRVNKVLSRHGVKSPEAFGSWGSTYNILGSQGTVDDLLADRELFWRATFDLTDLYNLACVIPGLVRWLQRVGLSCGLEHALCHIIIVEAIVLGPQPQIRTLGLCALYVFHLQEVSSVIMTLNCCLSPVDIINDNLIPDELGRSRWPVLNLGQLILRVQRVRGRPRSQESLALRLGPLYIVVAQVVLRFVQLEVEGTGAGTRDVPVLALELWPVQISSQLPRLCSFMKELEISYFQNP